MQNEKMKEQLAKVKGELNGRMEGVLRSRKGTYGFIRHYPENESRQDYFFHQDELRGHCVMALEVGDLLSFEVAEGEDGKEKAVNVVLEQERHLQKKETD